MFEAFVKDNKPTPLENEAFQDCMENLLKWLKQKDTSSTDNNDPADWWKNN